MDGASESQVRIKLVTTADPSGVQQTRDQYDGLFSDLKARLAEALNGERASPAFIQQAMQGMDDLRTKLDTAGEAASVEEFNRELQSLVANLQRAAEAEAKRIEQLKIGMQQALGEKQAEEERLALSRRRKEEDQVAAELDAIARRKRIAGMEIERDLARSVAQARQMSADQRIDREYAAKGAYDPAEEVARLKALEMQTAANARGMRAFKGDIGNAALMMSYFIDDAQYGLRGVMNNIPPLAMAFGLGGGVAGSISIAVVALNALWEKFGGAKEAAKQTEEVKAQTEALAKSIQQAAEEHSRLFKTGFDKYLADLKTATEYWEKQKGHISEALQFQDALAKAENEAAQSRLEIERQNKLAGAGSDDERAKINADYDVRKSQLTNQGQNEAMQRALDANALSQGTLKSRIQGAEGARDAASSSANDLTQKNSDIINGVGRNSDQARRNRERAENQGQIELGEANLRERVKRQGQRDPTQGGTAGLEYIAEQKAIEKEEAALKKLYETRNKLNATKEADEQAGKTGKGMTFNEAKEQAKGINDFKSLKQYEEAEKQLADNAEAAVKASEAAKAADEKIMQLKIELSDLLNQEKLLKAQQVAQAAAQQAQDAKRAADKQTANQKADEEHLKKQREEEARKLENDANELERQGYHSAATSKRNQAAKLKLPDNATDEQKRAVDLENKKRIDADVKRTLKEKQDRDAKDIGKKNSQLADNLGPAGKELKKAADKLSDGATDKELHELYDALLKLAPTLLARDKTNAKQYSDMAKRIKTLEQQLRNGRTGDS